MYLDTNHANIGKSYHQGNKMPIDIRRFVPFRRALVVDDDFAIREIVSRALENIGLNVRRAEDGRQAYELFLKGKWDLVVTDFMMPFMDGITLLDKIKQHAPSTPTILISGMNMDELTGKENRVADSVLSKPFKINDLHREVMRVIQ